MYQVKSKEDFIEIMDRGRCVICGEIAFSSVKLIRFTNGGQKREEQIMICNPHCEDTLKKIFEIPVEVDGECWRMEFPFEY